MTAGIHSPRGDAQPAPGPESGSWIRARGLAVWVVPGAGSEPSDTVIARAAQLLLERVLRIAPEAEVHLWPAHGAATSPAGGNPVPSSSPSEDSPQEDDDGARYPPPSDATPARVSVDLADGQVLLDGKPVPLTGVELRVLRYLAENCSRSIGRQELQLFLETLEFPGCAPRSIDVYVGRLRRKLGEARHAITTIRGGGYQFVPGPRVTIRGPAEYTI